MKPRPMVHLYQIPPDAVLQAVLEAYERGQTLDAQRRAETFAPLRLWGGVQGAALASRIAANTGAPKLALRLSIRAWRTDPHHPQAQLQFGFELAHMRGPLALWEAMRGWPESQGASSDERAELLALKARAVADLRDFDTAEALLDRAELLAPAVAWVRLQRAYLLERQDRVEEALEIAKAACALHPHPFYRPGVQTCAYLLQLLDRDQDAIELLHDADAVLQNGPLAAQRYALLSENGCWSEAEAALSRFITFSPLIERPVQKWVLAQQARVSYHLGRRSDAMRFASALEDDFHRTFTERLSPTPAEPERMQLDVTFVRQHFKTCAPATLAAIGRYWRMDAEHLKLAEAMCYDGTPSWQQRDWAEQNGWYVREFRMDEDSAVALIARGIPVAITTVEATSAHMMALVGFDRTWGTLLFRDPAQPYILEAPAKQFFERYRAFGPHGMVFLPLGERGRTEDMTLPDAEIYDEYHRFSLALAKHDRAGAEDILQRTEDAFPGHELTWGMRLDFAGYDANLTEQAQCLDKLLDRFPGNAALLLRRLACLRDAPREERITFLEKACAARDADPVLFIELARAMEGDARCLPKARRWLKHARRFLPMDSNTVSVQADLAWEEGRLDEATHLYRFAANLEGFREELYQSWFVACRRTRHTDEAMAHLQDRFVRFGSRSEQPALTLAWAWREMEQPGRAREVLIEAARLRPDDGILLLRSASFVASLGDTAETARLLRASRNKVRENDWLRMAAETAELQQDSRAALCWARDLLQLEPLALDAHGCVARVLARLEGPTAALTHLKQACAQFPHHYGLRRILMEWTREAGPEGAEATARDLVRLAPSDAWAQRELAMALSKANRHEEALNVAMESARIEPRNSYSFSLLGRIYQRLQRRPEARVQFRQAVELSADNSDALQALIDLAQTDQERKEELAFIEQQLIQQVVTGDGVLAFLELARPVLDSETLLCTLREAHRERPDLWHAWAALISQLGHLNRLDEALAVAQEATARFPHLPRIWLDLADVHRWRNEPKAEIAAAARAFEINPSWDRSAIMLAGGFEREGKLDEARHVYERALYHAGTNPQLHACQAHVLWRQHQKPEAFAALERALRLAPDYDWGWELLATWAKEFGEVQRAGNLARALTTERPGEPRVWIMVARVLEGPDTISERLAAVEQALKLDVHSTEAWDLKAEVLAIAERFDDAIRACEDGAAACIADLHILRGRRAWIEASQRNLPEAVRRIREVLAENASYVAGWNQLAQWLVEQGAFADAEAALEQLLRLRPHEPWVSRQLGILRLRQDDQEGAREAFAAALELVPTDMFSAHNLFTLQLQGNILDDAAATLRVMKTHQPGASTLAAETRLLLRRKNTPPALEVLKTLCAMPDPDPWPVDQAAQAFERAGLTTKALKVFRRSLKTGSCNPQVATAAIRLLLAKRRGISAVRLFSQLKTGEDQRRAGRPLIEGLVARKCRLVFRRLLRRRHEVLQSEDIAWGYVGFALVSFNRMKHAVDWLADWRQRSNVQPWMLFNLCLALRHLKRFNESNSVARHVLATWGHREGAAALHLFLAVEEALGGELSAAEDHLSRVETRKNMSYDQQMLALANALVEFQKTPWPARRKQFQALRRQLAPRFKALHSLSSNRDVRRTFARAGTLFRREGAGAGAQLWVLWKLYWQWLPLAAAGFAVLAVGLPPGVAIVPYILWLVYKSNR